MRKGNLAKMNDFRRTAWEDVEYRLRRPPTPEETQSWYNSDSSKGLNDAGETRLPPTCVYIDIDPETILKVERARCAVRLSYGNPEPKMTMVRVMSGKHIGEVAYCKRHRLEVL